MGTIPQNNKLKPKDSSGTHSGTATITAQGTEMSSTDCPSCPCRRLGRQRESSRVLSWAWVRTKEQQTAQGQHIEGGALKATTGKFNSSCTRRLSSTHQFGSHCGRVSHCTAILAYLNHREAEGESRQVLEGLDAEPGRSPLFWGRPCPVCAARTNLTLTARTQYTVYTHGSEPVSLFLLTRVPPRLKRGGRARGSFSIQLTPEVPDNLRSSRTRSRTSGGL